MNNNDVVVYAHGACFFGGTKHPMGGVAVFLADDHASNVKFAVREGHVTNQTMELRAAHTALRVIEQLWRPGVIATVHINSVYVMNCMTKWALRWELNGWITKNKRCVQNADTIRAMWPIVKTCNVGFKRPPPDATTAGSNYGLVQAESMARKAATDCARSGCHIRRGTCAITSILS